MHRRSRSLSGCENETAPIICCNDVIDDAKVDIYVIRRDDVIAHDNGVHCRPDEGPTNAASLARLCRLLDKGRYSESSVLIKHLEVSELESVFESLPVDLLIGSIPESVVTLEAVYCRLAPACLQHLLPRQLHPDRLLMRAAYWLSDCENGRHVGELSERHPHTLRSLLVHVCEAFPHTNVRTRERYETLRRCAETSSQHQLVQDSTNAKQVTLHDAILNESIRTIHNMKSIIHRLDDIGPSPRQRAVSRVAQSAGRSASVHQQAQGRNGPVMFAEVEQRLIKNKATLDVVEMYTSACSFTDLIGSLRQRVDSDEELLSCFNELRRELNIISNDNVDLTVFKNVISGYSKLVSVLEELSEKSPLTPTTATPDTINTTDTSNNTTTTATSDTTATTATTDNAATTDTTVIDTSATETSRDPPSLDTLQATYFTCTDESGKAERCQMSSLKQQVQRIETEFVRAQETIALLRERETTLTDRLSKQAQCQLVKRSTKFEDLSLGDNRPSQLVRRYGDMYAEGRLEALDVLDGMDELTDMDDLKSKLLLSIIILAFRSAQNGVRDLDSQCRHLINMVSDRSKDRGGSLEALKADLEGTIFLYLRKTIDQRDLTNNIQEVCDQVMATLYDYPQLRTCPGFLRYISDTVRIAWALTVQNPQYFLDFQSSLFNSDQHTRFFTSDCKSSVIKSYIWPALREGGPRGDGEGPIVCKGIVIT